MGTYFSQVWFCDPYGTLVVVAGLVAPVLAVAVPAALVWVTLRPKRATALS
jgi:hypothetical protein